MNNALFRHHGELYLAHNATITGDVRCGVGVNLWFNVVVRGDVAPITLGDFVNIQDGAIVHCDFDMPLVIEPGVVAGHAAILHGIRVGADTLVGMGATLLSGTDIGAECVIAAGSVVPPGLVVPPRSLVMGVPGRVVRTVTPEDVERTRAINRRYRELARQHAEGQFRFGE
jgi:carbonic anhydrase/acetyltransferase-like protein (isoleucine patch superfamily)